jgi:hypothetical protein
VNPIPTLSTTRGSSAAVGTMPEQSARLIIEAECTTCGPICDEPEGGISLVRLALAHSAATEHVVILNGTTDVPHGD